MRRAVQLVTRKEAAAMFGVSLRHFIDAIDSELPRLYFGRCVRFDVRDIEALVEKRKVRLQHSTGRAR